jgi:hypothetical protein
MSRSVTHRLVLTGFSRSSGKHLQIRIAIYPLYVFPNGASWPLQSEPDIGGPPTEKSQ